MSVDNFFKMLGVKRKDSETASSKSKPYCFKCNIIGKDYINRFCKCEEDNKK